MAPGIDRIAKPGDREIGKLLRDCFKPAADVVEFSSHVPKLAGGAQTARCLRGPSRVAA